MITISHIISIITSSAVNHTINIKINEVSVIKNDICEKYNNIKNIRTYHCSDYKTCIINGLFIVFVQKKEKLYFIYFLWRN